MNLKVDINNNNNSSLQDNLEFISCIKCKRVILNIENLKDSVKIIKTGSGKMVSDCVNNKFPSNKDNFNSIFAIIKDELKIDSQTLLYSSFTPITKDTQDYEYLMNNSIIFEKNDDSLNKKYDNVNEDVKSFSILKINDIKCKNCLHKNNLCGNLGKYIAIKIKFFTDKNQNKEKTENCFDESSNNNNHNCNLLNNNEIALYSIFLFYSELTYYKYYKRNKDITKANLFIVDPLIYNLKTNIIETIKMTNHVDTLNKNLKKSEKDVLENISHININMNKLKEQDKVVNQNENVQIINTKKDEKENCEDCNNK